MSLFGSREEDPLLQDDPFAPPSEESTSPSEQPDSLPDSAGVEREEDDQNDSVFEHGPAYTEDRLAYSVEDAMAGRLDELKAALDQGWVLDRIEVRRAGASSPPETLVFILHQSTPLV